MEVTGFQIDIGSVALPYRTNGATIQGELAACQRYYFRHTASAAYCPMLGIGAYDTTTNFNCTVIFPTSMRTGPTYSSSGGSTLAVKGIAFKATSASALNNSTTPLNASVDFTVTGATAGDGGTLFSNNNAAAYLEFSAEL